jgi:hypothetical protein
MLIFQSEWLLIAEIRNKSGPGANVQAGRLVRRLRTDS